MMESISEDNGDGISWDCCVGVYAWMSHLGIFGGISSSYTDRFCHLPSLIVMYDMYVCMCVYTYMSPIRISRDRLHAVRTDDKKGGKVTDRIGRE